MIVKNISVEFLWFNSLPHAIGKCAIFGIDSIELKPQVRSLNWPNGIVYFFVYHRLSDKLSVDLTIGRDRPTRAVCLLCPVPTRLALARPLEAGLRRNSLYTMDDGFFGLPPLARVPNPVLVSKAPAFQGVLVLVLRLPGPRICEYFRILVAAARQREPVHELSFFLGSGGYCLSYQLSKKDHVGRHCGLCSRR
jgi:hypothetical protein